jgi:FkbM family methyltransferase
MSLRVRDVRAKTLAIAARELMKSWTFRHHAGIPHTGYEPGLLRNRVRLLSLLDSKEGELGSLIRFINTNQHESYSQFFQDMWVLQKTNQKRGGFFVEFGATDGIYLSNTLQLEKDFGWTGILAEADPSWHRALVANRIAKIDKRCVLDQSGLLVKFASAKSPSLSSTVDTMSNDEHAQARREHTVIEVETVSLNDLLSDHGAPRRIDYISVDTEGTEYKIMNEFDFDKWTVDFFSIEHNHTAQEHALDSLMTARGYQRCLKEFSGCDAWYERT